MNSDKELKRLIYESLMAIWDKHANEKNHPFTHKLPSVVVPIAMQTKRFIVSEFCKLIAYLYVEYRQATATENKKRSLL